jgi:hypothetical protein
MGEDAAVATEVTEEGSTEPQQEQKAPEASKDKKGSSILEITESVMKGEKETVAPSPKEPEKELEKKPESKGERIQRLYLEEKGKNEELNREIGTLKNEVASIRDSLSSGKMSGKEATKATKDAEDAFKKAIDKMDLPQDLKPFKEDLAKFAFAIAQQVSQPLKDQLSVLQHERDKEYRERMEKGQKEFVDGLTTLYDSKSKEYPGIFMPLTEEDKAQGKVLPDMKPEFEKKAEEIYTKFNQWIKDPETGEEVLFNSLLSTDVGLELLFSYLNRDLERARLTEMEKVEKDRIKRSRVESPSPSRTSSSGVVKPVSILEITEQEIKARS